MQMIRAVGAFLAVAISVACRQGPTPQQIRLEKFRPLYRSARAMEGAIAVGVSNMRFTELLQTFATEVLAAGDIATDASERALVSAYVETLEAYKDSATLWKHQIESAKYDWLKGRIFQEEELVPLVAKYKLPTTQDNLVTGKSYTSLPAESVQLIWVVAGEKGKKARDLYLQPPAKQKP